jgi:SAM-dependent methyltransferase
MVFSDGSVSNRNLIKKECLFCGTIKTNLDIDLNTFYQDNYKPSRNIDTLVVVNNEDSNRSHFIYRWIVELEPNIEKNIFTSMLEMGCGQGFLLNHFNIKNKYGIEPSKDAYSIASKVGNIRNIGFESLDNNEKYDVLLSYCVIEHIANPKDFLKKSYNILSDKGLICIALPIQDKFNYDMFFADHLHHFNHKTFVTLLKNNGFEIVNYTLGKESYFNIGMYICKKRDTFILKDFTYIKNNNLENTLMIIKNIEISFSNNKLYAFGYGEITKTILPYFNLDNLIYKYIDDTIIHNKVITSMEMKKILSQSKEEITILLLINPIYMAKIKDIFIEFKHISYISLFDNIHLEF